MYNSTTDKSSAENHKAEFTQKYTVYGIRYSLFAIHYTGMAGHIRQHACPTLILFHHSTPLITAATFELDGIRCTKIEQVRFPLYYTIRSYTAFPNSTLLCEPVLGNPIVRFKLFACPRKRALYTRIVYSYVNSA